MRFLRAILLAFAVSRSASSQTYTVSTFAGGALPINLSGTSASVYPVHVAVDAAGNVFSVDRGTVLRLDAKTGVLALVAGNGTFGFSGDGGPATSAQLSGPQGLAVDSAGNLYIADSARVRKVSNGVITTVAGNTTVLGGDNGPATDAILAPAASAVDSAGNLYIADIGHQSIRKVSNGVITTVAGNGTQGFSGDNGPAASAQLSNPNGVAVDSAGDIYIADEYNNRIRKVSNGIIATVAGTGAQGFSGDSGPAASAQLYDSTSVAVDSAGNVYIADFQNQRIREVSSGVIATVAGTGIGGFNGDNGPATSAQLSFPVCITTDHAGNPYIADQYNARVRKISKGVISTIAGNGQLSFSGDNAPATNAELNGPAGVALDFLGNLYIADQNNDRIRMVSGGVITTVAGNGTAGFSGDGGPALNAGFIPIAVAVDSARNLYITDYESVRVREVSNGIITTVAGNGTIGYSGDNGPAINAQLDDPKGVAADSAGNLYIADSQNNCVRKVTKSIITTFARNGTYGFSGDNGPATNAQLRNPAGLAVDSAGNLYIADSGNGRIRKVSNGIITTVAGVTAAPGATFELDSPVGVALDSASNLYIAESLASRVTKATNGVISVVAGGSSGFSGDGGPAITAAFNAPVSLAVDSAGTTHASDNLVRMSRSLLLLLLPAAALLAQPQAPTPILLWASGAPGALGSGDADKPTITPYLVTGERATGTAVIVCPGGSYIHLSMEKEGSDVAHWWNSLGVTAFVLKYRLGPQYHHPIELGDAQRAIRTVRARAAEFGVKADRIGLMGFSAGGHLTATAGTHFDAGKADAADAIDRVGSRPDFLVLGYPVISFTQFVHKGSMQALLGDNPDPKLVENLSNELQVTAQTPPTFLFHTNADTTVPPENSVMFYLALRKAGVPAEMHIYEHGSHGQGLAPTDEALSSWPARLADWVRGRGLLK